MFNVCIIPSKRVYVGILLYYAMHLTVWFGSCLSNFSTSPLSPFHLFTFSTSSLNSLNSQVHDVLTGAQLCRGDITAMVAACPVTWRAGLEDVMGYCAQTDVPVLVFSAGLAGASDLGGSGAGGRFLVVSCGC